ncbi:MAG: hypothetical protein ACK5BV_07985 [Bacteroidota bacterium]
MLKKPLGQLTNWELWPFKVVYFPISFVWLWYMMKSRAVWFFTPSNPTLSFGGFEGEGKKEMYEQLPSHLIPKTMYVESDEDFGKVIFTLNTMGFRYPIVVKPDVGMKGILFRKIDTEEQLLEYHKKIPVTYIIQELIDLPLEVSVFYYRYPDSPKGKVSGFFAKELLHVIGNGTDSVHALIQQHPRARFREDELKRKHGHVFQHVLANGEKFYLSYAGNHNRGARFISLKNEIDDALHQVFDDLNKHVPHFYYGRYDIKTLSVEDLKAGRNYYILEYNGSGAEPNHIYDAGLTLWEAYREILHHWKVLYEISKYNHKNGYPYWSFKKGVDFLRQSNAHFKKLSTIE